MNRNVVEPLDFCLESGREQIGCNKADLRAWLPLLPDEIHDDQTER